MSPTVVAVVADAVVALAVIAAAVTLSLEGKIDGTTTLALVGVGVTLITGATKALVSLYAPVPAAPPPEPAPPSEQKV